MGAAIQFFRGVDEPVVPDIRMTRSRDGRTGQAIFVFEEPDALAPNAVGDITGMFMVNCSEMPPAWAFFQPLLGDRP